MGEWVIHICRPKASGHLPPALTKAKEVAMAQAQHRLYTVNAVREILSRGNPQCPPGHPTKAAHTEFVASFSGRPPNKIWAVNDADMKARAEHLEQAVTAFAAYVIAVSEDCNQWG